MKNFWQTLPRPFFALAPMEDVTDTVFRQIVALCAPPDVYFTEFVSVDGLCSRGRPKVEISLKYTEKERPLIAQIWGLEPKNYYTIAKELVERGFDGIDINMGCPVKKVAVKGACSALIKNSTLAKEIILATQEGAGGKLPVSVKTRIGFNTIVTEEWIGFLLSLGIDALTIHGRTAKEMSSVPAHWDEIGKAVNIRNSLGCKTIIIGNGDVKDREDGLVKVKEYGVDGIMIGRGIFQNLWAFASVSSETISVIPAEAGIRLNKERILDQVENDKINRMLDLMLTHCHLFHDTWGNTKSFLILRKFFKIYTSGFTGAAEWRDRFMKTKSVEEVEHLVKELKNSFPQARLDSFHSM